MFPPCKRDLSQMIVRRWARRRLANLIRRAKRSPANGEIQPCDTCSRCSGIARDAPDCRRSAKWSNRARHQLECRDRRVANPFDGVDVGSTARPASPTSTATATSTPSSGNDDGTLRYFENTGSAIAPAFARADRRRQPVQRRRRRRPTARPASATWTATATSTPSSGMCTARCSTSRTPARRIAPAYTAADRRRQPLQRHRRRGSHSAPSFGDLDGDGDLDVVVGERDGNLFYFENTGTATAPAFVQQTGAANPFDGVDVGYLQRAGFGDLDGDGDLDAVVGRTGTAPELSREHHAAGDRAGLRRSRPAPPTRSTASMWGSTARPASRTWTATATSTPSWGNATARCSISRTPARRSRRPSPSRPAPPIRSTASTWAFNSTPSFADLDGDGDLDAVVGVIDGTLRYFENTGSATAPAFADRRRPIPSAARCGDTTRAQLRGRRRRRRPRRPRRGQH